MEIGEFLVGCEKLKGKAKSYDVAMLQHDVAYLVKIFVDFAAFVEGSLMSLQRSSNIPVSQLNLVDGNGASSLEHGVSFIT